MNVSQFNVSMSNTYKFLKHCNLFRMKGIKSLAEHGVSDEFKEASQSGKYYDAYSKGLENYDYDFLLIDQSFFQFEYCQRPDCDEIRYAFYQNPIDFMSYKEYLESNPAYSCLDESIDEIGEIFYTEYQQFLDEQEINSVFTTIRYDTDLSNYSPLVHSVSHIHIGHNNNVRIPINKLISPLRFVIFVVKHVYYYLWKDLVLNDLVYLRTVLGEGNHGCQILESDQWENDEKLELYLT